MRSRAIVLVAVLALVVGVACRPRFSTGSTLGVANFGNGHRLTWPAATDPDGQAITSYRVDVDGTPVATVPGHVRTCQLTGLANGPHQVDVTATDSAGEWSGDLANDGRVSGSVSVSQPSGSGPSCAYTERWGGTQGPYGGNVSSVSADGRYVAFDSRVTDLHPGDTNPLYPDDIFLWDRATGVVTPVTPGGLNGGVDPAISADGEHVVFVGKGAGLVPGDTDNLANLILWDRTTGTFERITDAVPNYLSGPYEPVISADGGVVAYIREIYDPAQDDTGTTYQEVWVWDRATGTNTQVTDANDGTFDLSMSDDGRYLSFWSNAWNLVPAPTGVYLYDRITGTLVGVPSVGSPINSVTPEVTGDGEEVLFQTGAGTAAGLYAWNRTTGVTSLVIPYQTYLGQPATQRAVSADGSTVAFVSSSNLGPGDTNFRPDVYVFDRGVGLTRITETNVSGSVSIEHLSVSADGGAVTFGSDATTLVPDDTNDKRDIFVWDRTG